MARIEIDCAALVEIADLAHLLYAGYQETCGQVRQAKLAIQAGIDPAFPPTLMRVARENYSLLTCAADKWYPSIERLHRLVAVHLPGLFPQLTILGKPGRWYDERFDWATAERELRTIESTALSAAVPPAGNGDSGRKNPPKRPEEIDSAVARYRGEHLADYRGFCVRVQAGDASAVKEARAVFGRNVVADAIGLPDGSRALVGKSPEWIDIADALHLSRGKGAGGNPRPVRKVALELVAEHGRGVPTTPEPAAGGTVDHLQRELRKAKSKPHRDAIQSLLDKRLSGKVSPEAALELLDAVAKQETDRRSKVRSQA